MSSFQCSSLALNRHFPRAILYGPALLGGIGLPSPSARATKERINYFLYNIRRPPFIQQSFEVSLIFMQLEIVSFQQFFSQSYLRYGHLATKSMGVQIWSETEPYGLTLWPSLETTWLPSSLGHNDIPLMEIATNVYNTTGSAMINWCRLYLPSYHFMICYCMTLQMYILPLNRENVLHHVNPPFIGQTFLDPPNTTGSFGTTSSIHICTIIFPVGICLGLNYPLLDTWSTLLNIPITHTYLNTPKDKCANIISYPDGNPDQK